MANRTHLEAVTQRYSVKKMFLEISQNSEEYTCAGVSFLIKLQASGLRILQNFWEHVFLQNNSGGSFFLSAYQCKMEDKCTK